jgi:hypothetical protein
VQVVVNTMEMLSLKNLNQEKNMISVDSIPDSTWNKVGCISTDEPFIGHGSEYSAGKVQVLGLI